jgi:crotonobetainyl-CoA:carnitine CoA-transferase CaiB-like acyl-CoA transferase
MSLTYASLNNRELQQVKRVPHPGFDFLEGLTVLEVSQLGPDAVGGHLADLGARVIKIESPGEGDAIRFAGMHAVGGPHGFGFLHLRWNRGKESLGLDLRTPEGAEIFRKLIPRIDLVVEGQRANALARLGFGFQILREINPRLVICSVSGLGSTGPYQTLGSAAPSYDVYADLHGGIQGNQVRYSDSKSPLIAIHGTGLQAALAATAAVWKAQRTGMGSHIEIAAADVAALWLPDAIDVALNGGEVFRRPGFVDEAGKLLDWPRMEFYETKDSRKIFLQALKQKFWDRFCNAVGRSDLVVLDERHRGSENERIWREVSAIVRTRTLSEWMILLTEIDVPIISANTSEELIHDPQFVARKNVCTVELQSGQKLRLTSTPIKVAGYDFSATVAPSLGQHTEDILLELGINPESINQLRRNKIIS